MKYHGRGPGGGDVVVPIRRGEPSSVVIPVARKISGSEIVSPIEGRVAIIRDLTAAALAAYTAASEARAGGDSDRAKVLCNRAARALELVHETAVEIEAIA